MGVFTKSVVEEASLTWLESLDWAVKHGIYRPAAVPHSGPLPRRESCFEVVLAKRRRDALPSKLISGELRVDHAEKVVTGVV